VWIPPHRLPSLHIWPCCLPHARAYIALSAPLAIRPVLLIQRHRAHPADYPRQIPGLPEILSTLTYTSHPGLLGICLSGAGPTILALATGNFDVIAAEIQGIFKEHGVEVDWEVLEVDERGSWVEEVTGTAA
jgi:homoserine kinase